MKALTIGSLFSGIGGLELGIERAIPDSKTIWQVEQNPFARSVLKRHWPNARRYADVREVGSQNLEPVSILVGGFPCQDISQAGSRAGIDGERSGLWSEFARIIREIRPEYVVVENVAALLSNGMDRVVGEMAESGYDCQWDCIPASAVRARHRRDRIFIIGTLADTARANGSACLQTKDRQEKRKPRGSCCCSRTESNVADAIGRRIQPERRSENVFETTSEMERSEGISQLCSVDGCGEDVADPMCKGLERHGSTRNARKLRAQKQTGLFSRSLRHVAAWEPESDVGRVAHGVPDRVDRLRCLGNAVVPQVGEVIGRVILEMHGWQ